MVEKKSESSKINLDNSFGVSSVLMGILSISQLFGNNGFIQGLVFGVIALVFASKQNKINANKWSRIGKILGIFGLIINIILTIIVIVFIIQNYDKLAALGEGFNVQ